MAINTIDDSPIRIPPKLRAGHGNDELNTIYFSGNLTSQSSIASSRRQKTKQYDSPYLSNIQLLSRVTEKRILHKNVKGSNKPNAMITSSMQKSNSDETKKPFSKKNKKSVLTLPNVPAPKRKDFIVSDTNESEYFDCDIEGLDMKRRPPLSTKKNKQKEIRDSSDLVSCMSIEVPYKRKNKSNTLANKMKSERPRDKGAPPEVWDAIRKMNRMRFRPSPVISEESIKACKKKKKKGKRRNIHAEGSFIETFRTEEIAYISSVEYSSKTTTCCSKSMSNDRVTVIDRNQEMANLSEVFENQLASLYNKNNEQSGRKILRPAIKSQSVRRNQEKRKLDNRPLAIKDKKLKKPVAHLPTEKSSIHTVYAYDSFASGKYLTHDGSTDAFVQTPQVHQENVETPTRTRSPSIGQGRFSSPNTLHKPRLVTTMPSSNASPRNTTALEIRKKIQAYKYPLIIVGKDQIISNYEALDLNFPHIKAMDENIWPFMLEWNKPKVTTPRDFTSKPPLPQRNNINSEEIPKAPNKISSIVQKQDKRNINNKKQSVPQNPMSRKHNRVSMITEKELIEESGHLIQNANVIPTGINNITEKMLELLWKNDSADTDRLDNKYDEDCNHKHFTTPAIINSTVKSKTKKKDASIDTIIEFNLIPSDVILEHIEEKLPHIEKRPKQWSKIKRVNNLIDSVINKLQNGVYYEAGFRPPNIKGYSEVSIQTLFTIKPELELDDYFDSISNQQTEVNDSDLWSTVPKIPGFDDSIANLEIETFNKNQITLKDCNTNVSICFDITVEVPHSKSKKSINSTIYRPNNVMNYIPTSAAAKVFKYNTTISNTELPAMICSLLPKMVQNLATESESPLLQRIDEFMSPLSTITELVSPESAFPPLSTQIGNLVPAILPIPTPIKKLFKGSFSTGTRKVTSKSELVKLRTYEFQFTVNMLPKVSIDNMLSHMPLDKASHSFRLSLTYESVGTLTSDRSYDVISACKAIQMYHIAEDKKNLYNNTCVPVNPLLDSLRRARSQTLVHSVQYIPITITYDVFNNEIIVNMFGEDRTTTISVCIKNLMEDGFFEEYVRSCASCRSLPETENGDLRDEYAGREVALKKHKNVKRNRITKFSRYNNSNNVLRSNRKCFVKLYKKYKVASHFGQNEDYSTPLRKIHSMCDFLHLLGAGKTMLSVFDGNTEHKILTSLTLMQDWVSHINSQQALLVLLLNNKKDTPNLNQLRPMLLQGIAVNRITRANELDMEIEVIEQEKIHVSRTAEGIAYVPASVENCNQLYDELYWIAKTTASDYQKNFDDSSQKLLKSLLEKRKTLNPSYLRVMARYVGLGLLRSTKRE